MENYENNNVTPETEEVVGEEAVVEETPVEEANPYGQDFANYETPYMSKKEYLRSHAPAEFYKNIKILAIITYVLLALNVITLLFNPAGIVDIILLLVFTLMIHLKKVKGCAIAVLIYGIVSVIIGLISFGTPAGWLYIVFGIIYLVQFNKAEKEYKATYGA